MNRTWFTPGNLQIKATSITLLNDPSGNLFAPQVPGVSPASPQMVTIGNADGKLGSQAIPSGGVLSLGPVDTNPNANAGIITGTQLQLEPADATHPGVITSTAQTLGGPKTFGAAPILSTGVYSNSPSSPQMMVINASGILGSQALPVGPVYTANPIGTNNMSLNTGTITVMTVRSVSTASPWPIIMDVIQTGNVVQLRIPAFSINTTTGGTGTAISFSGALPVGMRPTTFGFNAWLTMFSNNTISSASNYITISTGGIITINTNTAWTTPFGLNLDTVLTYFSS